MKKLTCVLLALMMLLAFAACGEKEEVKPSINDAAETTESAYTIFSVTVLHADGEETQNRFSTECETLVEALLERNFMTEDMLTIDGERASAADGAYWTLYVDGVYVTDSWDTIVLESGVDYMFEYSMEFSYDEEGSDLEADADAGSVEETEEEAEVPEDETQG